MKIFHISFFHASAIGDMRKKFLELQQGDRTTNAYVAYFMRFNHFALTLIAKEEEREHTFQQGQKHHLREYLACQNYKTFSEVFEVTCHLEQVSMEERPSTFKRLFIQEVWEFLAK